MTWSGRSRPGLLQAPRDKAEPRLGKVVGDVGRASPFPYLAFIIMLIYLSLVVRLYVRAFAWRFLVGGHDHANDRSPINFRLSGLPIRSVFTRLYSRRNPLPSKGRNHAIGG
jgi:hypothetical protein